MYSPHNFKIDFELHIDNQIFDMRFNNIFRKNEKNFTCISDNEMNENIVNNNNISEYNDFNMIMFINSKYINITFFEERDNFLITIYDFNSNEVITYDFNYYFLHQSKEVKIKNLTYLD